MPAFKNSVGIVSRWQLDAEELAAVFQEGCAWMSILTHRFAPAFVGSEATVRQVMADYGALWPAEARGDGSVTEALRQLIALRDRTAGNVVLVPTDLIDRLTGAKR